MIWGRPNNEDDHVPVPAEVATVGSRVYFYGEVTTSSALAFIKELRDVDTNNVYRSARDDVPLNNIWVNVNSPGGDMFAALAIVDAIERCSSPVWGVGEGMVASAATLMLCACERRFVTAHTLTLFHQISAWFSGTHEQFRDEIKMQEMMMEKLVKFYEARSSLDEAFIRDMLKRDTWFSAEDMVKHGLAKVMDKRETSGVV